MRFAMQALARHAPSNNTILRPTSHATRDFISRHIYSLILRITAYFSDIDLIDDFASVPALHFFIIAKKMYFRAFTRLPKLMLIRQRSRLTTGFIHTTTWPVSINAEFHRHFSLVVELF
jgi:hypothetical protein